jgi:Tfp pilus assembly protein PilP
VKTSEYDAKRKALMERIAKRKGRSESAVVTTVAQAPAAPAVPALGSVDLDFEYDGRNRRDPFRSFEWERPDRMDDLAARGPLEQFDLAQLDLVAVVWNTGNARALVQDPSGQSYIVGAGARIGKNAGVVISISDDTIVVKETYVDFLGKETTKDIEMRIRGSEGGEFHVGIH